ncbi:phage major capsid protein [Cypionkella sp.]|uniref:phage major capsid protein n=1 Tax=Cypionkella sp. TaxID=2811411 RepID=UPI002AB86A68|nr:phage major capsid protein [Cypionkella sp.]MDZ4394087.1 phage major capsid protein [Cypionkella sp.]
MLQSAKLQKRQSEIRQRLAELAGKDNPTDDETRSMTDLDKEYGQNEQRYRAALIAEDEEKREAKGELETRSGKEYSELLHAFEVRQVAAYFSEGRELTGQTAEVVQEMRAAGGYSGVPVPLEALEQRNTVSGDNPAPKQTLGIFDRLFPQSVAARLGVQSVSIAQGSQEYPVATSGATAGWAATEGGDIAAATAFQTAEAVLSPDHLLGAQMAISRKAMKQTGAGLESAIRRDMSAAIGAELDRAILIGAGASGEPTGLVTGATNDNDMAAASPAWELFKVEIVAFMQANAITDPAMVRLALTPQIWSDLDGSIWSAGAGVTEWDRLVKHVGAGNIALATQLTAGTAILTTTAGGLAPAYLGLWGGVDVIRDPYSDAASGGLRLTGLLTTDLVMPRQAQVRVLSNFG